MNQDENKGLKQELFLQHFQDAQMISNRTYESLLNLTQSPSFSKNIIVAGLPFSNVLLFVERSVKELTNSVYEEMAESSYHSVWLDGMTEYLKERIEKMEIINEQVGCNLSV